MIWSKQKLFTNGKTNLQCKYCQPTLDYYAIPQRTYFGLDTPPLLTKTTIWQK